MFPLWRLLRWLGKWNAIFVITWFVWIELPPQTTATAADASSRTSEAARYGTKRLARAHANCIFHARTRVHVLLCVHVNYFTDFLHVHIATTGRPVRWTRLDHRKEHKITVNIMDIEKLKTLLNCTLYQPHRNSAEEQLQQVNVFFVDTDSNRVVLSMKARAARIPLLVFSLFVVSSRMLMYPFEGYFV